MSSGTTGASSTATDDALAIGDGAPWRAGVTTAGCAEVATGASGAGGDDGEPNTWS